MAEDDGGLPEESQGKLEQSNAVLVEATGPWKNSDDMWTFQNISDFDEYAEEIALGQDPVVVLVIDNVDAELAMYPNNKHYWVIAPLTYDSGTTIVQTNHLTEYFSILVEEGSATMEDFNTESNLDFVGPGRIKINTYQGYPIYIRDPAIDDSRPVSQTGSTTGATTSTTVRTTTTATPGAAGIVTESETIPAEVGPSVVGGRGNGAAEVAARRAAAAATTTAPTTVTQTPSTSTRANQSAATPSSSNVYIYEPLTPGFDRYDFNTGKKVYTPDAGPSRNSSAQPVSPQPTPRVSPTANSPDNAPTRPLPTRPGQTRPDRTPSQLLPGQISGPF